MREMTCIDWFSGIGGFRLGLQRAGIRCVGFCEKNPFAVKSYRAMYDTEGEWYAEDITNIPPDTIPAADIWTTGTTCQNYSVKRVIPKKEKKAHKMRQSGKTAFPNTDLQRQNWRGITTGHSICCTASDAKRMLPAARLSGFPV